MIDYKTALEVLFANSQPIGIEKVPLSKANHRRLAEDAIAAWDSPRFDNSRVDGYAVKLDQLPPAEQEINLPVIYESRAGSDWNTFDKKDQAGAVRVSTGAPIPPGFTAVLMQEDVTRIETGIHFRKESAQPFYIRRTGEDFASGAILARQGEVLDPGLISILAQGGVSHPAVYKVPRVHLVINGDELATAPRSAMLKRETYPMPDHQIPDSISPAIGALLHQIGLDLKVFYAPDDKEQVNEVLNQASQNCDLLISVGGVSVGDHDHVRHAFLENHFTQQFWKVLVKPGMPTCFFTRELPKKRQYGLGLPGNPVSAQTMMQVFGIPLIDALGGAKPQSCLKTGQAILSSALHEKSQRLEFVRGVLTSTTNGLRVQPLSHRESHMVSGFAGANCLIFLPPGESIEAGEMVKVLPLSNSALSTLF